MFAKLAGQCADSQSDPPPLPPLRHIHFQKTRIATVETYLQASKQLQKLMGEVMVATADVYTVKFNRCNISRHLGTIPTFESVLCY